MTSVLSGLFIFIEYLMKTMMPHDFVWKTKKSLFVQKMYFACWKENQQHYQYNAYWLQASNQWDLL